MLATKATMTAITQFLNFAASNPDVTSYHPLCTQRYGSARRKRRFLPHRSQISIVCCRFPLSQQSLNGPYQTATHNAASLPGNGAINVLCTIFKEVVSSAAEAELLAALFHNAKKERSLSALSYARVSRSSVIPIHLPQLSLTITQPPV